MVGGEDMCEFPTPAFGCRQNGRLLGRVDEAVRPVSGSCTSTPKLSVRQRKTSSSNGFMIQTVFAFTISPQCREGCYEVQGASDSFSPCTPISSISEEFYHSPLGHFAEHSIAMALFVALGAAAGRAACGVGYAVPYLDRFRTGTERTFAFMPAGQGR